MLLMANTTYDEFTRYSVTSTSDINLFQGSYTSIIHEINLFKSYKIKLFVKK